MSPVNLYLNFWSKDESKQRNKAAGSARRGLDYAKGGRRSAGLRPAAAPCALSQPDRRAGLAVTGWEKHSQPDRGAIEPAAGRRRVGGSRATRGRGVAAQRP